MQTHRTVLFCELRMLTDKYPLVMWLSSCTVSIFSTHGILNVFPAPLIPHPLLPPFPGNPSPYGPFHSPDIECAVRRSFISKIQGVYVDLKRGYGLYSSDLSFFLIPPSKAKKGTKGFARCCLL